MKTFKFLQFVKYPVLIFVALLGIYLASNESLSTTITPTEVAEIGGNQSKPQDPGPVGLSETADIGGQRVPGTTIPLGVADIGGGGNQNKPQVPDPLGIIGSTLIVGNSTPKSGGNPIGIVPSIANNDDTTITRQIPPRSGGMLIGGQSSPRNGGGTFLTFTQTEPIGGQNQDNPKDMNPIGIQVQRLALPANFGDKINESLLKFPPRVCTYDLADDFLIRNFLEIGGNQGIPQQPLPLGFPVK